MTYEHVARIPFLIDASHLTPEEAAERDANPALWAAQRYGQPEHIFQAAALRHGSELCRRERSNSLTNYATDTTTTQVRVAPPCLTPYIPAHPATTEVHTELQSSARSACSQSHSSSNASNKLDPDTPDASSPSGTYSSTVLSPSPPLDETDIASPPRVQRTIRGEPAKAHGQPTVHKESVSSKKKG